jgi:site-specific recombinase XerC
MKKELCFPALLECFFMQRLMAQRQVSPHTIRSYRDTFRLLLQFAAKRLHKLPSALALTDLDPGLIGAFLDQLEKERGNSARSRNLRLTATRSFFRYAAFEDPSQSGLIQRVLAMPSKRYEKKLVCPSSIDWKKATTLTFQPHMGKAKTCHASGTEYFFQGGWTGPRLVLQRAHRK